MCNVPLEEILSLSVPYLQLQFFSYGFGKQNNTKFAARVEQTGIMCNYFKSLQKIRLGIVFLTYRIFFIFQKLSLGYCAAS